MTRFSLSSRGGRRWLLPAALLGLWLANGGDVGRAQALQPALITDAQSQQAPYRDSGRMEVVQGTKSYIGTGSYVRRYTGLTAGHILFAPKSGFSTQVRYQPALDEVSDGETSVPYFAVLAGYQGAVDQDPDSLASFDQDMGYMIFGLAAKNDEWAAWVADPNVLTNRGNYLVLGYAAETFDGDVLAFVQHQQPYYQIASPGLYENTSYYTQGGMSGGPVYAPLAGGGMAVAAVNVAGAASKQHPLSDARAITPDVAPLLVAAEYAQGMITGGVIKGKTTVARGGTSKYKTGVSFVDGQREQYELPVKYDDTSLTATGPYKAQVQITKLQLGKYRVAFGAGIPAGGQVTLRLLRTALPSKGQTPLQKLTVTVQ